MSIHLMSWACHHHDGMIHITHGMEEVGSHIIGILNHLQRTLIPSVQMRGRFLIQNHEIVFTTSNFNVNSVPYIIHFSFSQAFNESLYKVLVKSGFLGAWAQLLLLPCCTLHVVKPHNKLDTKYGNHKSLKQHDILFSLATWRE